MMPGDHQDFHAQVVIPIHFHPKESGEVSFHQDEDDHLSSSSPQPLSGASQPKQDPKQEALCGSGAYSTVYRVKIEPSHHNLSEV